MVVDDDASTLNFIWEVISGQCSAFFTTNGEDALKELDVFQPDIILLDVVLPGISGLDVCRIIREKDIANRPQIVIISACASCGEVDLGYAAGADFYLTKPFGHEQLEQLIEGCCFPADDTPELHTKDLKEYIQRVLI